jgi:prepilin-type N-terminal cleavage/methylation domain-containing protein
MKGLRRGEKGFTLIELLIVVAILGILAAVIVPNLATFLGTGQVAAANTEVANVESAALAYYADNNGNWPTDCISATLSLMHPPAGDANAYISAPGPKYNYVFGAGSNGKVQIADGATTTLYGGVTLKWNLAGHKWTK